MNHLSLEHMGAWSFGDSKRSQVRKSSEEFPGPGTYDPRFSKSCSGWTQSKHNKNATFIKDGAGAAVGTYTPSESLVFPHSAKYSMGGGETRSKVIRSLTRETNHTPSTALTKFKNPVYSFGYVPEPLSNFSTPAPGEYSSEITQQRFNRSQNHFTRGTRESKKKATPGVGEYDVRQNQTPGFSYKMGVLRDSIMKSQSPDKFYTISGDMKSFQKGKTLGARCQKSSIIMPNDNPAPGAYEPNLIESRKGIAAVKAERTSVVPEQSKHIPGPGAYHSHMEEISEKSTKGIKFTNSKRPQNLYNMTPGPGRYEAPSSLRTVLGKMSQKIRNSYADQTPGPGSYTPQHLLAKTRRSLTMYSNRVDFSKSDTKHIGPGAYDSSNGIKPQFGTMSRSRRESACTKTPGPGQYQILTTIGRIPKYFKNLSKKIEQNGSTKTITYTPAKTKEIRLKTTSNTLDKKYESVK